MDFIMWGVIMTIEEYAKKILSDHGCDEYTYGGEYSKHVLDDLKQEYPNGMEFPYIDVANAILAISRPEPIARSPWQMVWNNDSCVDGIDFESFGAAEECAEDTLVLWQTHEASNYPSDLNDWNEEQIEDWDYMIYNFSVRVDKYNPDTDEYEQYWSPSYEDEKAIGWELYEDLLKDMLF